MDTKEMLEITYKIRNFMKLKNNSPWITNNSKLVFNTYKSPDGALGFFILLKKNQFKISNLSEEEKSVVPHLIFDCKLSQIKNSTTKERIQDKFEEHTHNILKKLDDKTKKVTDSKMSDYDFECKGITIEVKSDKWKHTGNISLELLRDYNADYDRNIGSILKTKATFWQEYFYDESKDEVSSEMFRTSDLKDALKHILIQINKEVDENVKKQ